MVKKQCGTARRQNSLMPTRCEVASLHGAGNATHITPGHHQVHHLQAYIPTPRHCSLQDDEPLAQISFLCTSQDPTHLRAPQPGERLVCNVDLECRQGERKGTGSRSGRFEGRDARACDTPTLIHCSCREVLAREDIVDGLISKTHLHAVALAQTRYTRMS